MKKIAAALIVAGIGLFAVTPAIAAPGNPHQEEQDGCDHGHTGKPCRPDPQPTKGKDCVKHGKHGGINEDHCAGTTNTTQPPTTTTTRPGVTTTTQPGTTGTTVPGTTGTTVPGTKATNPVPGNTPLPGDVRVSETPISGELAHTGSWSLFLALLGTAAGLTGLGLMLFSRSLRRSEES